MSVLDHRGLRQFLAVAENGTVRAAARALNISQPPLTAAIRQLEARLGVALFQRSVKGMALTPAGEALAEEARLVLGRLERAERRVAAIAGRPEPLRIGFVSAALNGPLQSLLRGLKTGAEPAPRITEMTTPEQIDAFRDGHLDVGLLHPPFPAVPGIDGYSLGRDPFWAAVPIRHPLAKHATLRFANIAKEPFVLFPEAQGPALHAAIKELVALNGGTIEIAAEARRVHSQLALVSGGLGVGLVTRSAAMTLTFQGVAMIPLEETEDRLFVELHAMAEPGTLTRLSPMLGDSYSSSWRIA